MFGKNALMDEIDELKLRLKDKTEKYDALVESVKCSVDSENILARAEILRTRKK